MLSEHILRAATVLSVCVAFVRSLNESDFRTSFSRWIPTEGRQRCRPPLFRNLANACFRRNSDFGSRFEFRLIKWPRAVLLKTSFRPLHDKNTNTQCYSTSVTPKLGQSFFLNFQKLNATTRKIRLFLLESAPSPRPYVVLRLTVSSLPNHSRNKFEKTF